ncbi:LL-diaminopimelate aminotransferase [Clostridiaceae bacterium 35-E11]
MDIITNLIADRLGGKSFDRLEQDYKFIKIKKAKREMRIQYPDIPIIDLGIGEPDAPADPSIVSILAEEAGKPENRWYADNGIVAFQEAAVKYLETIYGLRNIDPYREVLHGIGAKSILSILPMCFINKDDIAITTAPGYPVIATHTQYLGGIPYYMPLYKENHFYPDFSKIPEHILQKAKLLYLNYPNNPTGQVATQKFFEEVVAFAHKNNIAVISDASYGAVTFDDYKPLSFLSIDGAKEVGVEIHSLSKAYNMTGWRLAFIAGNEKIVRAYGNVKGNTDSGQFIGIQKAGVYALSHPEITASICKKYSRRFDLLVNALREVGFDAKKPKGTFYCYVPIPSGTKSGIVFSDAEEVAQYLLKNALVSTVPWDAAGSYLRLSVTFEAQDANDERRIIETLKHRLLKLELIF